MGVNDGSRPRVVVVDDEVDFLKLIERWLKTKYDVPSLTVIFLTGSKSDRDFVNYLDFGGCRYMTKPITGKELREAVAEQLGLTTAG